MSAMKAFNVNDAQFEYDDADPEGYRGGMVHLKERIGARTMTGKLFELPPGQALCPYHWETDEEWLILLEGRLRVRHPEGEDEIGPGSVVAFPAGPEGAHKTTTVGDAPARFIFLSTANLPGVAVYPDSDKIGLWTGDPDLHVLVRKGTRLDYYDGEV
jgi:uncharacterized cupin superfamily protein